ncbi:hypothetical protein [Azonexus hydrophilus]|uniref:hypothetical protein n=1 Tax=Azonexus hydrophilus TaxID=418702 RepID=UPI003C76B0F6
MAELILALCEQSKPTQLLVMDFPSGLRQILPVGQLARAEEYTHCGQQIRHPRGPSPASAVSVRVIDTKEAIELGYFPEPVMTRWLKGAKLMREEVAEIISELSDCDKARLLTGQCIVDRLEYDTIMALLPDTGYRPAIPSAWVRLLRSVDVAFPAAMSVLLGRLVDIDHALGGATSQTPIVPLNPANCFSAFTTVSPEKCRVVILGQDPYPNRHHAMGLAFSVPEGEKLPRSLSNIYKGSSQKTENKAR